MFQWNTRIATVFIVSAAMAITAAAQPQHNSSRASRSACPSRSARTARGARATGIGAKSRAADGRTASCATHRRTASCAAHRRTASRASASWRAAHGATPRCAAAVYPSVRRPARLGHGAASTDAANLCGSGAATAANNRPQYRRTSWIEGGPARPARQSRAPSPSSGPCGSGGRCRSSAVCSHRTRWGPATKRGSAAGRSSADGPRRCIAQRSSG